MQLERMQLQLHPWPFSACARSSSSEPREDVDLYRVLLGIDPCMLIGWFYRRLFCSILYPPPTLATACPPPWICILSLEGGLDRYLGSAVICNSYFGGEKTSYRAHSIKETRLVPPAIHHSTPLDRTFPITAVPDTGGQESSFLCPSAHFVEAGHLCIKARISSTYVSKGLPMFSPTPPIYVPTSGIK